MIDMKEVTLWGIEAVEVAKAHKASKQARQKITFGNKSMFVKKGEQIDMSLFEKGR